MLFGLRPHSTVGKYELSTSAHRKPNNDQQIAGEIANSARLVHSLHVDMHKSNATVLYCLNPSKSDISCNILCKNDKIMKVHFKETTRLGTKEC